MTEDQARLNAASLSRTLRVGRQMTAFTDALFGGKVVADPFTDPTKEGIFRDHSCYRCDSGNKPCIKGKGRERDCDTLHARND
jgi:hypothetical protein